MSSPTIRPAIPADVPALRALIEKSVRGLQAGDYTPEQLTHALATSFTVDSHLIADGTYFVVEAPGSTDLVACGGWSKRRTLYGGDAVGARDDTFLDPTRDRARIRAFFVHPAWARRGLGTLMLDYCEHAARAAGFTHFELGATLTGVALYAARGYTALEEIDAPIGHGLTMRVIRMAK
jgi:GNAT superfamily N-acetyltransferase